MHGVEKTNINNCWWEDEHTLQRQARLMRLAQELELKDAVDGLQGLLAGPDAR
jgi:hypothetical protein